MFNRHPYSKLGTEEKKGASQANTKGRLFRGGLT